MNAPPDDAVEGERWIIGTDPAGAWEGKASQIALWSGGSWIFLVPKSGFAVHVEDERLMVHFSDGEWRERIVGTMNGGGIRLIAIEQEVTLAGAFVETTAPAIIADRMIVLAVASRTTQAIAGAQSYSVGIAGEPGKFGSVLGIALGSTNIGVIGPTAIYAATRCGSSFMR